MDLSCHISQRGHLERTSGYVREIPNGTERSQSLGLYDVIIESESQKLELCQVRLGGGHASAYLGKPYQINFDNDSK